MSKFTPGPWKVMDGAILSEKLNAYGNWIVTSIERERTEEDNANLRLISSAPDLLAACYAAMGSIIGLGFENTEKRIRDAIAKAEGRTE